MTVLTKSLLPTGLPLALLALLWSMPSAHAGDFPSDVKRTFTTDIPHFFQDDIPCAFGGQPTSGTKSSCHGPSHPAAQKTQGRKGKRPAKQQPAAVTDQSASGASAGASAGSMTTTPSDR